MYNTVALIIFTLCAAITSISKTFQITPNRDVLFALPPALGNLNLVSVSVNLPILDIPSKWNHATFVLLCSDRDFLEHQVLKQTNKKMPFLAFANRLCAGSPLQYLARLQLSLGISPRLTHWVFTRLL